MFLPHAMAHGTSMDDVSRDVGTLDLDQRSFQVELRARAQAEFALLGLESLSSCI